MSTMDCAACREILGDFLDGELGEGDRTSVQAHLDGCEACHSELAHLAAGTRALASGLEALASRAPPLEGFLDGVRERLATARPGEEAGSGAEALPPPARPGHLDPTSRAPEWMRAVPALTATTGLFGQGRLENTLHVFRALAALLKAGRPLAGAVALIAAQEDGEKGTWAAVQALVNGGIPLSEALRTQPDRFPDYLCEAIAAGEESGRLGQVLDELTVVLGERIETSQKISASLMYPFVILGIMCVIVTFVTMMILPKFVVIFARHAAALPAATRFLIDFAGARATISTIFTVAVGAIVLAGYALFRLHWGREGIDALKLRIPVCRQLHGQELLGWFCSIASVLIRGGIPVPRALQLAGRASPNRVFQAFTDEVVHDVASGITLTEAVTGSPVFPPDARHIIASGEETNALAASFETVSQLYRARLHRELQMLVAVVEPAAILGLGVLVSGFIYGVYRPVFMMARVVSGT